MTERPRYDRRSRKIAQRALRLNAAVWAAVWVPLAVLYMWLVIGEAIDGSDAVLSQVFVGALFGALLGVSLVGGLLTYRRFRKLVLEAPDAVSAGVVTLNRSRWWVRPFKAGTLTLSRGGDGVLDLEVSLAGAQRLSRWKTGQKVHVLAGWEIGQKGTGPDRRGREGPVILMGLTRDVLLGSGSPPDPKIRRWSPKQGRAGQQVMITGSNFIGVTAVKLGTTPTKFTTNGPTKITAVLPEISPPDGRSAYYDWSVTTLSGTGSTDAPRPHERFLVPAPRQRRGAQR